MALYLDFALDTRRTVVLSFVLSLVFCVYCVLLVRVMCMCYVRCKVVVCRFRFSARGVVLISYHKQFQHGLWASPCSDGDRPAGCGLAVLKNVKPPVLKSDREKSDKS